MRSEMSLKIQPFLEHPTTAKLRKIMHYIYTDTCQYCGKPCDGKGCIDHIIPRCRGGKSVIQNYTLACHKCNATKGSNLLNQEKQENCLSLAKDHAEMIEALLGPRQQQHVRLNKTEKRFYTFYNFPSELWEQLNARATEDHTPIQQLIINALRRYLGV